MGIRILTTISYHDSLTAGLGGGSGMHRQWERDVWYRLFSPVEKWPEIYSIILHGTRKQMPSQSIHSTYKRTLQFRWQDITLMQQLKETEERLCASWQKSIYMPRTLGLGWRDLRSRPKTATIFCGPRPVTASLSPSFLLCPKRDLKEKSEDPSNPNLYAVDKGLRDSEETALDWSLKHAFLGETTVHLSCHSPQGRGSTSAPEHWAHR